MLQILSGQGIVATETEKRLVAPGDIITLRAGQWYWHGAPRDAPMRHRSIKQPGPTAGQVEEQNWPAGYDPYPVAGSALELRRSGL